jgi:hypothetical protein
MFTLLAFASVIYVWTRPSTTLGFFGKMALTIFICSGGCGLGACLGTM